MTVKKAFQLRIGEDIWQSLRRWSDDDLRSVNAQIEYLLRDALREAGRLPYPSQEDGEDPQEK